MRAVRGQRGRGARGLLLPRLGLRLGLGLAAVLAAAGLGRGGVAAGTAAAAAASTVRDLRAELYRGLGGAAACVRLLHRGGAAGCAAEGPAGRAEGRLRAYAPGLDLSAAAGPTVVVARAGPELAALLARAADGEPGLAGLAGVLVDPRGDPGAVGWSPEDAALQAAFAPYGAYAWNPSGTGLLQRALDVPVFLLAAEDAEAVAGWSAANERGAHRGAEYVAAAQLTMYAAGSPDSPACLREGRCLPLGGYSTYAVVPAAVEAGPAAAGKPALLVTAQMDGTALFHDAIGNGFALSGLLAMLAAFKECARLLQGVGTEAAVDLVFVAFAGESWGEAPTRPCCCCCCCCCCACADAPDLRRVHGLAGLRAGRAAGRPGGQPRAPGGPHRGRPGAGVSGRRRRGGRARLPPRLRGGAGLWRRAGRRWRRRPRRRAS